MLSALAEPPWCVCSAGLGTPAVFPLGVMWLAALLGFPCWLILYAWQAVREALLFLLSYWWSYALQRGGGGAPSSGPSGFRRWEPSPFRTLSGGCLSLHWQAWRDRGAEPWVVEVLRLGYCLPFLSTPSLPLFPSQCLLTAPPPSRGLLWRRSPWA